MIALRATALLLLASAALAQDRPTEEDIFGKPAQETPSTPSTGGARPGNGQAGEPEPSAAEAEREGPRALEPDLAAERRLLESLVRTEDPLKIGGLLYLRSNLYSREQTPPSHWTFTAPSLTDAYLDARPTDRVRGFVLGRMFFDPTLPSTSSSSNPKVLLDQLWLSYDLHRRAFVTLGRQHVKWGVGRFWNPTDYLHAVRRDPLAVFDERTGTFMARVQLPWERLGWNLSAVAVFEKLGMQATSTFVSSVEQPTSTTATTSPGPSSDTVGAIGAGARAEIVLGSWELGLDAVAQRGIRPRYGIDLSGGLWELDLRGELSLRTSSDVPLYRGSLTSFTTYEPAGIRPAAVLGIDWAHKYSDEDAFTMSFEYFYNSNGYAASDRGLYPVLLAKNAFPFYYLGTHYAAVALLLPKPGSWDLHSFTFSALANLSDRSGIVRFDWNMTFLTYVVLEAYVQGHLGIKGGEFRLSIDVPALPTSGGTTSPVFLGAPVVDFGLALKLGL